MVKPIFVSACILLLTTGLAAQIVFPNDPGTGTVVLTGETKQWHKITLTFDGPFYEESATSPNPFLDYRLQVLFTNGTRSYLVPGYFAADGNAGESSATSGNQWRVHFAPDTVGNWSYAVSFRLGEALALSDDANAGTPVPPIDGAAGTFEVTASDKTGRDFRGKGRLEYVGARYLRFADSGEYFLKGGADAPENLLAYDDFDNTPNIGNRRKSWSPHAGDWQPGDPSWQVDKGTELIGALNYLASKGLNAFSFLTMNIGGDDQNVFPYLDATDFEHFDCSKLDQWEIIFAHADQLGLHLHFKTQETENDHLLDGGAVGPQRMLYYRELIARFGHHLALNWNLGEENTQSTSQRKAMADYFWQHDPYRHPIVIHTYPNQQNAIYTPLLGDASFLTGASVQTAWDDVYAATLQWVLASTASGKPWVVANDEQGNANIGVPPDPGYPGYTGSQPDLHDIRKQTLWGNLLAGGAGVEYYFGYQLPESDLSLQDFRSRDASWDYVAIALDFIREHVPFTQVLPDNSLVTTGRCLAQVDSLYLIQLPQGGTASLQFNDTAAYRIQWFNPRNGELSDGTLMTVQGPGLKALGMPPDSPTEDWVILVTRLPDGPVSNSNLQWNREGITVYPNPAAHILQVSLPEKVKGTWAIIDQRGARVQSGQLNAPNQQFEIDISQLPNGHYQLVVMGENQQLRSENFTAKFAKVFR